MNTSVSRKTGENVRNQRVTKLVTNEGRINQLVSQSNSHIKKNFDR